MAETKLQSGVIVNVTPAQFEEADALTTAVMKALKGLPITDNPLEMQMTQVMDAIINIATDPEVKAALRKCMERATWNNRPCLISLFDDPTVGIDARKDYFEICKAVVMENCGPFFVGPLSALKALKEKNIATQK